MLGTGAKSSDCRKSCVDTSRSAWLGVGMDELDPVRELVVEAMAELEQALIDGLPAQAPKSDCDDVCVGLSTFKSRIRAALRKADLAEYQLKKFRKP